MARHEPTNLRAGTALARLDAIDHDLILACLRAAANGPFFPDWEFATLFGVEREELRAVVAAWPDVDDHAAAGFLGINNSLANLLGYPHGRDELLTAMVGAERSEIERAFTRWHDALRECS